jgi:CDP-4-dehydro-6-deoxyglucose reductase
MAISFEGKTFDLLAGETVLEGIERQGSSAPFFCRRGVCQACLLRAPAGAVPPVAQKGLKDSLRKQGFFLACVCKPLGDLLVERGPSCERFVCRVEHVSVFSDTVLKVSISVPVGFEYEAGQFVQLERPEDGLMRPYSIASLPGSAWLELHVALLPDGAMSGWLRTAQGRAVVLRGPFGECFYRSGEPERPLLCAGTGTGLAPLLGVVRAALAAGHRGPIRLYHGGVSWAGLYMWGELVSLLDRAPQLSLTGSLLSGASKPEQGFEEAARCAVQIRPLDEVVLGDWRPAAADRVYLCGHPLLVRKLEKQLYLAGAALERIHSDPFLAPAARAS